MKSPQLKMLEKMAKEKALKKVYSDGKVEFKCDNCGEIFTYKINLDNHIKKCWKVKK